MHERKIGVSPAHYFGGNLILQHVYQRRSLFLKTFCELLLCACLACLVHAEFGANFIIVDYAAEKLLQNIFAVYSALNSAFSDTHIKFLWKHFLRSFLRYCPVCRDPQIAQLHTRQLEYDWQIRLNNWRIFSIEMPQGWPPWPGQYSAHCQGGGITGLSPYL
jgi:hypothetical protein